MKYNWLRYAASLIVTGAVVVSSVFLPQVLLRQQVQSRLEAETVLVNGSYHNRQHPRPTPEPTASPVPTDTAAPSPTVQSNWLEGDLLKKIRMMEDPGSLTMQSQPGEGEMTMKQAVDLCIKQLENLVKSNAMLPLPNFPGDYTMNASQYTILPPDADEEFSYWNISFSANPEQTKAQTGIGLIMDAETGGILQFKMYSNSPDTENFMMADALKSIANDLGVTGKVMKLPEREAEQQTAVLVSDGKKLFFTLYMTQDHKYSSLALVIGTRLPEQ